MRKAFILLTCIAFYGINASAQLKELTADQMLKGNTKGSHQRASKSWRVER
jgi:hypothetical protein